MTQRNHFLLLVISGLLIFLFVYTATSKLFDLGSFRFTLSTSPLLGRFNLSYIAAIAIPLAELGVAALLTYAKTRRMGLTGSVLLMAVFTIYIAYMLAFKTQLPCSCGGVLKSLSWKDHLWFNGVFLGLSCIGLVLSSKHLSLKIKTYIIHNELVLQP